MPKTKRTAEEVAAEISALEALKLRVVPTSHFGDDNHAAIQAQIDFLRGDLDITTTEFEDETPQYEQDGVYDADGWLNSGGDAPSKDWAGLAT
jgi:hypothetical protein